MNSQVNSGRDRQRARTRKLVLEAASRLVGEGVVPTVELAADAAEVSHATGYRYFPSQGALLQDLVEVSFQDLPSDLFSGEDSISRVDDLIDVGFANLVDNELLDRAILRLALEQWLRNRAGMDLKEEPVTREGRKPLVEAILDPVRGQLDRSTFENLRAGLGMVLGIESFIALNDVYGLSPQKIGEVWRWACKAMVQQALEETKKGLSPRRSKTLGRGRKR